MFFWKWSCTAISLLFSCFLSFFCFYENLKDLLVYWIAQSPIQFRIQELQALCWIWVYIAILDKLLFCSPYFCTRDSAQCPFVNSYYMGGIIHVLFAYHIPLVFTWKLLHKTKISQAHESYHTYILGCWQRLFMFEKCLSKRQAHPTFPEYCFLQSWFPLWRGHCRIESTLHYRIL